MNIKESTIAKLKELYIIEFVTETNIFEDTPVPPSQATHISILWEIVDGEKLLVMEKIKTPKKKEVTVEWVLNKLNKDSLYTNFASVFSKLLKEKGYGSSAYATSYGIGVFVAFGFRKNINAAIMNIEAMLNDLNIDYKTERSNAGWVFRFRLSKSQANINRIKEIVNASI